MRFSKSELDESVLLAWVGSPAQSQMNLFSVVMPLKNMTEAVTCDMASYDWLKLTALCLFRAQIVSKNKSICDRKAIDLHLCLIHSPIHITWSGRHKVTHEPWPQLES